MAKTEAEMRAYIERTGMEYVTAYDMSMDEINVLYRIAMTREIWDMMSLAFKFGQAKGFRYAKNRGTGK